MARYCRLHSGAVGLKGTAAELVEGQIVTVEANEWSRGGGLTRLKVGRVLWTDHTSAIAMIAREKRDPKKDKKAFAKYLGGSPRPPKGPAGMTRRLRNAWS